MKSSTVSFCPPCPFFTYLTCAAVGIADRVKNFAVLYVCDLDQVPDFKQMYELYDPVTLMFFFRNKHMVGGLLVILDMLTHYLLMTSYRCAILGQGITIS